MITPQQIDLKAANKTYSIRVFDSSKGGVNLIKKPVNIFASGPSISQVIFDKNLLLAPSIFVNGSLSLIGDYSFENITGYVISDARFIEHNGDVIQKYYKGEPLYSTLTVIKALAQKYPEIVEKYHQSINVIFPVDRPLTPIEYKIDWYPKFIAKIFDSKKLPLTQFADHPNFVIDVINTSQTIGVSFNITDGFVEGGTVAYIAAQLAYSLGATEINLYGIDLINSNQPRFYESKDNAAPCKLDKAISDRIVPSFDLLARVYKENGIQVINHSPVSKDLFQDLQTS